MHKTKAGVMNKAVPRSVSRQTGSGDFMARYILATFFALSIYAIAAFMTALTSLPA